ncbi:MAG TPA: hypothetical protein VLU96_09950 [Gaiellaceae bacterium]|nr:hypothetical protein [Gaiellaceae bacterium]
MVTCVESNGVRLCHLQYRAGRIEPCRETDCPFWEEGGAALPGGCVLQRLDLDLDATPSLVHALLQVRRGLAQAVTTEDEREARSLFYRLVPAAREDD